MPRCGGTIDLRKASAWIGYAVRMSIAAKYTKEYCEKAFGPSLAVMKLSDLRIVNVWVTRTGATAMAISICVQ